MLAHEFGHFTGGDTRLSALVVRGRVQIGRVIGQFHAKADDKVAADRARQEKKSAKRVAKGKKAKEIDTTGVGATYRTMAKIYTAYGKFYLRASLSTARGQSTPPTWPRPGSPDATRPRRRCARSRCCPPPTTST